MPIDSPVLDSATAKQQSLIGLPVLCRRRKTAVSTLRVFRAHRFDGAGGVQFALASA